MMHLVLALAALACLGIVPATCAWLIAGRTRRWAEGLWSDDVRLALSVVVGLLTIVLVAESLVKAGLLTTTGVWAACGVVVAACIAISLWWRSHFPVRPHARTWEGARYAAIAMAAVTLATAPHLAAIVLRSDLLPGPAPWYYWSISQSIARLGRLPEATMEWGVMVPPFATHLGFNSVGALLAVAQGDVNSLAAPHLIRAATLLMFGLGIWCVVRAYGGSRAWSTLAIIAALSIDRYLIKLDSFRPESAAYGVALLGVGLFVWGMRQRSRTILLFAGLALVGANQLHGITAVLAVVLLGAAACAHVLFPTAPGLESKRGSGTLRSRLTWVGLFAVASATTTALVNVVMNGHVLGEIGDVPEISHVRSDGFDPTWAFYQLVMAAPDLDRIGFGAPSNLQIAVSGAGARVGLFSEGVDTWMVLSVPVVVALFALFYRPIRPVAVFGVAALALTGALAWWIASTGDAYVPRRTGMQRLLQLWPLIPALVLGAGGTHIQRWLVTQVSGLRMRVASIVVAVLAAAALVHLAGRIPSLNGGGPTPAEMATVRALPIEPGAIVLSNGFTQGFVEVATPGHAVTDAQAPYLNRPLLLRANTFLHAARRYFHDPRAHPFPFSRYRIDYVLVARRPWALGGSTTWEPHRVGAVAGDRRLELIRHSPTYQLYSVTDARR